MCSFNCGQTYSLRRFHLDTVKEVLALSWQDGSAGKGVCSSKLTTGVKSLEPTVGRPNSMCKAPAHRASSCKQMKNN